MTTKPEPRLPAEFTEALADTTFHTLLDWLQANSAPKEAIDLLFGFESLANYTRLIESNAPARATDNYGIFDVIASTTNAIAACGGEFHGKYTITLPREKVITWPSQSAEVKQ